MASNTAQTTTTDDQPATIREMRSTLDFSRVVEETEITKKEPGYRIKYYKIDLLRLVNGDGQKDFSENIVFGALTLKDAETQLRASARELVGDGWTKSGDLETWNGYLMLSFDGSVKVAKFEKNVKVGDEIKDMEVARLWIAPRDG